MIDVHQAARSSGVALPPGSGILGLHLDLDLSLVASTSSHWSTRFSHLLVPAGLEAVVALMTELFYHSMWPQFARLVVVIKLG